MRERFNPPAYMEQGSKGNAVNPVLQFLRDKVAASGGISLIQLNGEYGEMAVATMKVYQQSRGLSADGGCGPETRAQMMREGFDFNAALSALGENAGVTVFVQPNNSPSLYWGPGIQSSSDQSLAVSRFRRAWYGN